MVSFYDPRNAADLDRVERLLKSDGIEYFTRRESVSGIGPLQILVAEEDVPRAEQIFMKTR